MVTSQLHTQTYIYIHTSERHILGWYHFILLGEQKNVYERLAYNVAA